ncbi:hypothetical protein [Catellatospora methionotrophica]|uniref:hypothetical protein n=1 Tax=Catellatospora methionotrophica TaxID=121620 RepID=UPI0033D66C21
MSRAVSKSAVENARALLADHVRRPDDTCHCGRRYDDACRRHRAYALSTLRLAGEEP